MEFDALSSPFCYGEKHGSLTCFYQKKFAIYDWSVVFRPAFLQRLMKSAEIGRGTVAAQLAFALPIIAHPCPRNRRTFDDEIAISQNSAIITSDLSAIFQKSYINRDFS